MRGGRAGGMEMGLLGPGGASTSEIDAQADDLEQLLDQVEAGLQEIQSISGVSERQAQVKFLHEKVTRAKNLHHSMKVELQDVEARDQKKYGGKVNDFERRLKKAQTELRAAKNSAQKADLVDGASPSTKDPGLMQDQEMLDEAANIQSKDKAATRRMLKMVNQTEDIAASTMDTMKNQTEQLSKIHADLEEMDSTLKLADAQIKQYMRKMATDKLIMVMLFLIVIGIVVIMGLKTFGYFGEDADDGHAPDAPAMLRDLGRRAMQTTMLSAVPSSGRGATVLSDYIL